MFKIKIAELIIRIDHKYEFVSRLCEPYKVSDAAKEDFGVSASEQEIAAESEGEENFSMPYCESLCLYRKLCLKLVRYDGFLMHSAVIELDGEAYVFAAKSGVGKTTHIRLWMQKFGSRCHVINGDKPVYRFLGGKLYAFGTPWCGKEGLGENRSAPVRAICFLERSPVNQIRRLTQAEVIGRIFHQLLMPKEEEGITRFLSMVERTISTVGCYLLRCNMEREAAAAAYRGMGRMAEDSRGG